MNQRAHFIYIFVLVLVAAGIFGIFLFNGKDYYLTPKNERHSHSQHDLLKPTGLVGHGAGIVGSFFMLTGVFGYMARKRIRRLGKIGFLKHWLEFHIFLCALGPILVLYHTTFKFGGIVAISFWSMVAVVISGIIGRFVYLQIPRSIEGRELTLSELKKQESLLHSELMESSGFDPSLLSLTEPSEELVPSDRNKNIFGRIIYRLKAERILMANVRKELKKRKLKGRNYKRQIRIFRTRIILNRRIVWLSLMQELFRYWHVAHLPFALIMLVIMIVHVIVAVFFGYTWIF